MLLNYRFENFMSFQENVEFSMIAPKTKVKQRFPDNFVSLGQKCDILKTAVIVGENAGGKSNFVRSLEYLQSFVRDNESVKAYRSKIHVNNIKGKCMKNNHTEQCFDIEIRSKNNYFYKYDLKIDSCGIIKEELSLKNQWKHKYRKVLSVFREEYKLECEEEECEQKNSCNTILCAKYKYDIPGFEPEMELLLKNAINSQKHMGLFITKLAILGNEHAVNFTDWIRKTLCPETNIINYDIYKSMRNEDEDLQILYDPRFLDIFRLIDYSIKEIVVDEDHPFTKSMIIRKKRDNNTFSRELGQDSSGVREFFAWAVQIFKVVYEDKIVFADEIDRVLNPVLSDRIIAFINGMKHRGQFIFTTHNVLHLNLKNYMKEQIYFITKDVESLESELYSLADFPEVRYDTAKIYELYMKGILGGASVE